MSEIKLEAKEGIDQDTIESVKLLGEKYKYGFSTDIDMDYALAIKIKYEEGLIKKREINALIKDLPEHIKEFALEQIEKVDEEN